MRPGRALSISTGVTGCRSVIVALIGRFDSAPGLGPSAVSDYSPGLFHGTAELSQIEGRFLKQVGIDLN
jgi:hypothetical protein